MMTLYSGTTCPFSQRCRIVLYEKGMDFQIIDVDLYNKPEDLAVMNPYNRTPVLVERDLILYESNIINEYIDDRFAWQKVERDGVLVYWSGDDATIAEVALDVTADALPGIVDAIPIDPALPLRIYIYPTVADLRAGLRLTGRDWVGSHAHPELGVIMLAANNPQTAAAELSEAHGRHGLAWAELGAMRDERRTDGLRSGGRAGL